MNSEILKMEEKYKKVASVYLSYTGKPKTRDFKFAEKAYKRFTIDDLKQAYKILLKDKPLAKSKRRRIFNDVIFNIHLVGFIEYRINIKKENSYLHTLWEGLK